MYKTKILKQCYNRFVSPRRSGTYFRTRSNSDGSNLKNISNEKKLHTDNVRTQSKAMLRRPPSPTGADRQVRHGHVAMAKLAAEPFLNGTSSTYIEEMYYSWLDNPEAVHKVQFCDHFLSNVNAFLIFLIFCYDAVSYNLGF